MQVVVGPRPRQDGPCVRYLQLLASDRKRCGPWGEATLLVQVAGNQLQHMLVASHVERVHWPVRAALQGFARCLLDGGNAVQLAGSECVELQTGPDGARPHLDGKRLVVKGKL